MVRIQSENENTRIGDSLGERRAEVILAAYLEAGLIEDKKIDKLLTRAEAEITYLSDAASGPELEYFIPLSKIDRVGLRKLVRITDPELA